MHVDGILARVRLEGQRSAELLEATDPRQLACLRVPLSKLILDAVNQGIVLRVQNETGGTVINLLPLPAEGLQVVPCKF